MAKRPELLVTNGELAGRRFVVGEKGLRLGRSSSNDIHIPDEELSRNHCMFECVSDDGVRIIDLDSANGTFVNGHQLGKDPLLLKAGDEIVVGATVLKALGEEPVEPPKPQANIDLGLDKKSAHATKAKRRAPLATVLWLIAILAIGAAAYVVMFVPRPNASAQQTTLPDEQEAVVREMYYEKVDANSTGIFRYELILTPDGVLKVSVDDVPKENRHLKKSQRLDARSLNELNSILALKSMREIDREYVGVEPDPPALQCWSLRVVYSTCVRRVRIVNMQEPEAFRAIREKLEAFSKNQLGVWALQYSRDKLIELAVEAIHLGQVKWEDREVKYGNLFASLTAYREALFYLETVNPKPPCMQEAKDGLERATQELDKRYRDQRFLADRALNMNQWDVAQRELTTLLEMVPERTDDRHRDAASKLVDVEKRLKGAK